MFLLWPCWLLMISAVFLARDDFRSRRVSVVWLTILGMAAVVEGLRKDGLYLMLQHVTINAVLLLLLGIAMVSWQFLRRRQIRTFFITDMGIGDVIMALAIVPLFTPICYVRFLLYAALLALLWWCMRRPSTIPLAGFMALMLVVYTIEHIIGDVWS